MTGTFFINKFETNANIMINNIYIVMPCITLLDAINPPISIPCVQITLYTY